MGLYIFEVTHAAPRAVNAPSAAAIVAAFNAASMPRPDVGGWVGRPRITRRGGLVPNFGGLLGGSPQNQTTAVALYAVPDSASLRRSVAILAAVRDRLRSAVAAIAGLDGYWSDVLVVSFVEALNGPLAWWESGEAARTRTEEAFPTLTTDADEYPRGPTTSETHPTTVAETLDQMAARATRAVETGTDLTWALTALAAVALIGYGAWSVQTGRLSLRLPTATT